MNMENEDRYQFDPSFGKLGYVIIIIAVLIAIFAAVFFLTMWVSVPVGSAVVMVDPLGGTISEPVVGPTFATKAPWVNAVQVKISVDTLRVWGDGSDRTADFPTVKSFSEDQLEMDVDMMIRWRLDSAKVKQLYENLPQLNWKNDVISSISREQVRIVTKEFSTIETIEQRELVAQAMGAAIWTKISASAPLASAIVDFEFELRNIGYPARYTTSIEDKLVAEQQKIQAEFQRQIIVINATANAERITIAAAANANATVIEAKATKEAIELVLEASGADASNETRIAELYLVMQTLQRIAPDVDILIMSPDGTSFILPASTS